MGFKCGIVGLPNVGKSTLFNALTKAIQAQAENYPFCTIEPNSGIVTVPDGRLDRLAKLANSQRIIPNTLEIVDIAGLVKGASKGEGLGNQFLENIRSVDAIIHMLRCFDDGNIVHVEESVNPVRDLEIIMAELILADLSSLETRKQNLAKKAKSNDKEAKEMYDVVCQCLEHLENERFEDIKKIDPYYLNILGLLSVKPAIYVCNVPEGDILSGNEYVEKMKKHIEQSSILLVSAAIESEIVNLSEEEQKEYLQELSLKESGLDQVIRLGYATLDLITYFTAGPKEARAWSIPKGYTAPQAAGKIHTDFERGFICAEVIAFDDYISCEGEQGAKNAGKLRQEGKEYIVQDGDVIHFRFNV